MKAVIQRVNYAKCIIDGNLKGECKKGFMILLGVLEGDTAEDAEILVISQFALAADCKHGRRPSFTDAAPPSEAIPLYEYFTKLLTEAGVKSVQTGEFGADMQIELVNDGPVTIILDSKEL